MEIVISSLTYIYPSGVTALQDISLSTIPGECVAIIGQNGAGKTSLVKHLNGLLRPTSGSVSVGGWDTRKFTIAQQAARVGYVFQNPDDQLFQTTVSAEVGFGPGNLGWSTEKVGQAVQGALEMVGLQQSNTLHPYDLSMADRKRLALACVLAMDTPIVILDEPTTGQDFLGIKRMGDIVDTLHNQGKTVIAVTHDIDFCAEHFDRTLVMAGGRILIDGSTRWASSSDPRRSPRQAFSLRRWCAWLSVSVCQGHRFQ